MDRKVAQMKLLRFSLGATRMKRTKNEDPRGRVRVWPNRDGLDMSSGQKVNIWVEGCQAKGSICRRRVSPRPPLKILTSLLTL